MPSAEIITIGTELLLGEIVNTNTQVIALAFLAAQARLHCLTVFLLRPYFLSPKSGNIWAKSRFNCSFDSHFDKHVVRVVRGRSPGRVVFTLEDA